VIPRRRDLFLMISESRDAFDNCFALMFLEQTTAEPEEE
jgi:hypothetical protein